MAALLASSYRRKYSVTRLRRESGPWRASSTTMAAYSGRPSPIPTAAASLRYIASPNHSRAKARLTSSRNGSLPVPSASAAGFTSTPPGNATAAGPDSSLNRPRSSGDSTTCGAAMFLSSGPKSFPSTSHIESICCAPGGWIVLQWLRGPENRGAGLALRGPGRVFSRHHVAGHGRRIELEVMFGFVPRLFLSLRHAASEDEVIGGNADGEFRRFWSVGIRAKGRASAAAARGTIRASRDESCSRR